MPTGQIPAIHDLVSALPPDFKRLPAPRAASGQSERHSVCIVTGELAGPDFNGGIGTANLGLAQVLAGAGHSVEILYTRVHEGEPHPSPADFARHAEALAQQGIVLRHVAHSGVWNDWLGKSYAVLNALSQVPFDTVFFNDTHGNGFASLLAKQTGLAALQQTLLVVVAHSASQWIFDINQQPIANDAEIRLIEMERRSAELADVLISPSTYLLATYRSYGWNLPKQSYVHPNFLPLTSLPPKRSARLNGAPEELVFFGRLETRKGLWLFCNALDRLKHLLAGRRVTFLGRPVEEEGGSTALRLLDRAAAWPFDVRLMTDCDSLSALAYLARRNCVAVMPSLADNSPCAIAECLATGIPFISTSGSGIEELIAPKDRAACLVRPAVGPLAEKLELILREGHAPARPVTAANPQSVFIGWLNMELAKLRKKRLKPVETDLSPCLLLVLQEREKDSTQQWAERALARLPDNSRALIISQQSHKSSGPVSWTASDTFAAALEREVADTGGPIVICTESLPIQEAALARVKACFASRADIVAVSGLTTEGSQGAPLPFGPSPATMSLFRESNQGYAFLRPGAARALLDCPPFDLENGRLIPSRTWLHHVFSCLVASGQRCELLPDLQIPSAAGAASASFEGFDPIEGGSRAEPSAPGDFPIIQHMATAQLQREERRRAALDCFAGQPRLGKVARELSGPAGSREMLPLIAKMARISGHPETAVELLRASMAAGMAEAGAPDSLEDALYYEAHTISLLDLALEGNAEKRNLDHAWSFKLVPAAREMELHPNPLSEGRATLQFHDINLERTGRLQTMVGGPQRTGNPVICRIDILCADRSDRLATEITLQPGESKPVDIELPASLRRHCQISLSVVMAFDGDATKDSWVRWRDPLLCPHTVHSDCLEPADGGQS